MTGTIDLEDDDGEEEGVTVALKYEVCSTCEGKGKHVNPSIDGRIDSMLEDRAHGEWERAAERRMGA